MKKLAGLAGFLVVLYVTMIVVEPKTRTVDNHQNLAKRIGRYGILCLGVTPLIISGGIDLSIGAVVGFCATLLPILVNELGWNMHVSVLSVLFAGSIIGLFNGLLVTKLRLQPFVVTLCGLFIFRGLARSIAGDSIVGVGSSFTWYIQLLNGEWLGIPKFFIIFLIFAGIMAVVVHLSVYGRYWQAIGSNEKTAYYSGIAVDRYKIAAYVICSLAAAFYSVLHITEYRSSTPSQEGNFFELYAIAGAVIGGISLRGGEGNILGVILGTSIMWILPMMTRMLGIPDTFQDMVIGSALLVGAILDVVLRRRVER